MRDKTLIHLQGFAAWCNSKLSVRSLKIDTLTQLHDGVLLIALIEILSGKKIEGYVAKPGEKKIVQLNNVTLALKALADLGVPVSGISAAGIVLLNKNLSVSEHSATAFVDADTSCMLALIWSIIQFYQLDQSVFGGISG